MSWQDDPVVGDEHSAVAEPQMTTPIATGKWSKDIEVPSRDGQQAKWINDPEVPSVKFDVNDPVMINTMNSVVSKINQNGESPMQWIRRSAKVSEGAVPGGTFHGKSDTNKPHPKSELTEKGFKSQFPNLEWNEEYAKEFEKSAKAYADARKMNSSYVPTMLQAKNLAKSTPTDRESRERLLEAIHELAVENAKSGRGASGGGLEGRAAASLSTAVEKLGSEADDFAGSGLNDDRARFARQIYNARNASDPINKPDSPWYEQGAIGAAGMVPALGVSALGGGVFSGVGKVSGVLKKAAEMAPFYPGIRDAAYDEALDRGSSPSSAKWQADISALMQSALFSGIGKNLSPELIGNAGARKIASSVSKNFAKTVAEGSSMMGAASAIDESVHEIANGDPDMSKILNAAAQGFKTGLKTMPFLAVPKAMGEVVANKYRMPTEMPESDAIALINKLALENKAPSRSQWRDMGFSPEQGRSAEDRLSLVKTWAEGFNKNPLAKGIPEQYGVTQETVDDIKDSANRLRMPEGKQLETLYPADGDKPEVLGEYLGTVRGKRVMAVDQEAVNNRLIKDRTQRDFNMGSNHKVDDFVPDDQFWVRNKIDQKELPKIATHEAVEYHMLDSNPDMKYDTPTPEHPVPAHEIANSIEWGLADESQGGDIHQSKVHEEETNDPNAPQPEPEQEPVSDSKRVRENIKGVKKQSKLSPSDLVKLVMRNTKAEIAQMNAATKADIGKLDDIFSSMTPRERVEFAINMDKGLPQSSPELDGVASELDRVTKDKWSEVQEARGSDEFMENYYPRNFKHTKDSDDLIDKITRGPSGKSYLKGGFLNRRKYPTLEEALAAGLEQVDDNPVRATINKIGQMNEWLAKDKERTILKKLGVWKFIPPDYNMKSGYRVPNDRMFEVSVKAGMTLTESVDQLALEQVSGVANQLGIAMSRVSDIPTGVWGEALLGAAKPLVRTKVGGQLSVLFHEIGHQIGQMYDLHNHILWGDHSDIGVTLTPDELSEEWGKIAALRYEGRNPSDPYKEYVQSAPEREAVLLESWYQNPEKMRQLAPNITKIWEQFLENNEAISPLRTIDRSLVLGRQETEIPQNGIRVLGHWAVPHEVADLYDKQLGLGLRDSNNNKVQTSYKLARMYGNAQNQANLGFSGFHTVGVMLNATATQAGLGIQQIVRGELQKGLKNVGKSPIAGITLAKSGRKIQYAMRQHIDEIEDPATKKIVEDGLFAGARESMDSIYANNSYRAMKDSFYGMKNSEGWAKVPKAASTAVHAIFAGIEGAAAPIMKYQVPWTKLGTFELLSKDINERAESLGLSELQRRYQLAQSWDSIENRMGQLTYDNLFWNQYVKDISQLCVRSVGWNLGTIREYGGALTDFTNISERIDRGGEGLSGKQSYVIGATITYATVGALMTYAMNGRGPRSLLDYFFPPTNKKNPDGSDERYGLPTYSKDIYSFATHPWKTAGHKIHPMWSTLLDCFNNQDYYGTKIRNEDDPIMKQLIHGVGYVAKSFSPYSSLNFQKMREANEPIWKSAVMSGFGVTSAPSYITQTPALKLANKYLSDQMPSGSRTQEQADKSNTKKGFIKKLREKANVSEDDIKGLNVKDVKEAERISNMSPLQAKVSRLSPEHAMDVFLSGDKNEQEDLLELVSRKYNKAKDKTESMNQKWEKILSEVNAQK